EEAALSPDNRWVAFNELHNAYVVPLPQTSSREPVDVAVDGALPVAQLTDEGGEWVGWADQGRTLTWIFGPTYHRLALDKAFPPAAETPAAPAAGPAKDARKDDPKKDDAKALPKSDRIEVALEVPRDAPTGVVAYEGARIVTMKGDEVI